MKTLNYFLFFMLAVSMGAACSSEEDIPGQKPDDTHELDSLKSRLAGEWVIPGQNSYIYTFADNDTIYIQTQAGATIDRWPYQAIVSDSIQIARRNWITHNKVVFYSNDSILIEDFIPSLAAVFPPMFGDVVLVRPKSKEEFIPTEIGVQDYVLVSCSWQYSKLKMDSVYLINSQEELSAIISCKENDVPDIDFNKYSLLLVRGVTTSGIHAFEKQLCQISLNEYSLHVNITLNATAVVQGWFIAIIVPKLSPNAIVALNKNEHP